MITRNITKIFKKKGVIHVLLLIFILGFFASAPPRAQAQIPQYINYQGRLTDADDNPVTGDVSITIRLYDSETGGNPLWTETQTVTVTRGIFSMLLGSSESLANLDFNSEYWYSVEVESDGEMTPRQRLTTVAYAINADKLDGYDASQFLRADTDTELSGNLTVTGGVITGGANEDVEINPTGTGNIVMTIDSTSGDFKITDGTTNWVIVDNDTGNVTIAKDLTVNGTIYGTLASSGGNSTFSSIVVTGTSDLRGNISNSTGAVTVADALTQTGSSNQVTFAGNVDANNGLDVTGNLTVSGTSTLSGKLDLNSNLDLDYSGTSAALDVNQQSTGPAAKFSGQRVVIGASEASNAYALSAGELYVQGDLEVDGTIYGDISASGSTSLGSATSSDLTVTGTSDLQGNVDVGAGIDITGAANFAGGTTYNIDSAGAATFKTLNITQTDSSTSGTATTAIVQPTYQDGGTDSTTTAIAMNIAPTINYTADSRTGSYTALKIAATETSLPDGTNYLIDAYAGTNGTTQKFYVDNSGNVKIYGTLNMSSNKITNLATPTADTDAATKAYADSITPATAGGWTDGTGIVYVTTTSDNVGIGTTDPGSYKLNVAGSTNVTSLYINGTEVTSTATQLNDIVIKSPSSSQTITSQDATATPLILKGATSQSADLFDVQDSSANSHFTVEADGDIQIDTSGAAALSTITQSDASASLAIATDTTQLGGGAGADSDGVLKLGINEGDYQYIWYDTDAGTDSNGAFVFSDQAVIPTASPAYLNFGVDFNSTTKRFEKYYAIKLDPDPDNDPATDLQKFSVVSIPTPGANWQDSEKPLFDISSNGSFNIYDPTTGDAVFQIESGGKIAHDFRNLIKNGSFEAFSILESFHEANPTAGTTTGGSGYRYEGGWDNFAPDEWTWKNGYVFQYAPEIYEGSGTTVDRTQEVLEGKSAVAIQDPDTSSSDSYPLTGSESSYSDGHIAQLIKDLKPNTWYSIGVAIRVDDPQYTQGIVDITGEYNPTTTLVSPISATGTPSSIQVASTDNFPDAGTLLIDQELFSYTKKSDTVFKNITRSVNSTTAASHSANTQVKGIFKPIISATTTYQTSKGVFKTDSQASDITVHLIAKSTDTTNTYTEARFDTVQIVAGKVVPEFMPSTITDTGDQTIYGTLRMGRTADGRGGILAVDQFVRTRGIEFFKKDPGFTGAAGGTGGVEPATASGSNAGTLSLTTSGEYYGVNPCDFRVWITNASTPNTFSWEYMEHYPDNTSSSWITGGSNITIDSTWTDPDSPHELFNGVKIYFSDNYGGAVNDEWYFSAFGMDPHAGYDSFSGSATYEHGGARIFKDPFSRKLTLMDEGRKVTLDQIANLVGEPAFVEEPYYYPPAAGAGGTLWCTTAGSNYTGSNQKSYEIEIDGEGTGSTADTFKWSNGVFDGGEADGQYWDEMNVPITGAVQTLIAHDNMNNPIDDGVQIQFRDSYSGYFNEGVVGDRWRFTAYPATGGTLSFDNTTATSFRIGSNSTADPLDVSLNFYDYDSATSTGTDRSIKWDDTQNKFVISDDVVIQGSIAATNVVATGSTTTGTTSTTFSVDTDLGATSTEPADGAGFIITGGSGDLGLTYDATNNYLDITGQTGAADTFTGINIPSGAKYKIGGTDLSASDVGAAAAQHTHQTSDIIGLGALATLDAVSGGTGGTITDATITDADIASNAAIAQSKLNLAITDNEIASNAAIATSKLADATNINDAITKRHTQGTDTTLGTMTANINMGGHKVTNLGAPASGTDAATKTYVDNAIAGLHWQEPVKAIQADPPATPASGDRYIVDTNGTGAWLNKDKDIAEYNGTGWDFTAPQLSYAVFNDADNAGYVYNGTDWVAFSGATAYTWGTGLTNTGTTVSIDSTVVTLDGTQTLTNKTIDGTTNTLQNIPDSALNTISTAGKVADTALSTNVSLLGQSIESGEITDGTITDADISTTAAISDTKLATISTAGKVSGSAVQLNTQGAITNSTGLKVNLETVNPGLAITNNKLDVKLASNQGLTKTANGMQVDYDNSTIGIVSNKLSVKPGGLDSSHLSASAGILDSQLAISPTTRFYENFAEYVETGLQPATSVNLTSNISAGTAYVRGVRVNKASATAHTYTASKDTYVDIDSSGNFHFTEVANGAAEPAVAANSLRLAKVVTDASSITGVSDMRNLYPVTANEIAPGAVTSTGIEDGSVGTAKLADNAVTSIKIQDGTIVDADIAANAAIATSKLSGPVTSIANNGLGALATLDAVSGGTGGTITDATITDADIASNAAIAQSKLSLAITDSEVAAGAAIAGTKISPDFGSQNILTTGNIGIGTAVPSEKLDVAGDIIANHLELRGGSPATITFGQGTAAKQLQFDATTQEFSFTGGTLKQAFQNLIKNPSFEATNPMGWQELTGAGTYAISTNVFKFGTKSAMIKDTSGSDNQGIFMPISDYDQDWKRLLGNTVTLYFWAKADSNVTTTIGFDSTGTEQNTSADELVPEQTNDINLTTSWKNFTISYDVPATATKLNLILYGARYNVNGSNTYTQNIYFDGLTMVEGKLALEYGPSPIFDTGNQVIYGSLAIGANYDPYTSSNYYEAPRLIFGQPDSYFGGGYGGWGPGSGEIRFMKLGNQSAGRFVFNRPVWLKDDYGTDYGATLKIGGDDTTSPDYAGKRGDVFVVGRVEIDGQTATSTTPSLIVGNLGAGKSIDYANSGNGTRTGDVYIADRLEVDGGIYGDLTGTVTGNITGDADTVDNLHASSTPQANKLLALNASSQFPISVIPQGQGSGFNADLLDGQEGSYYMPASTDNWVNTDGDTMTGSLAMNYTVAGKVTTLTKTATAAAGVNVTEYDLDISRQLTQPPSGTSIWSGAVARIQNYANIAGVGELTDNTAVLELNQASTGNTLVLKDAGTPVVTFTKTGDIVFGSGADTITSASGNNLNIKLGDVAGTNKLSVQTSAGAEKFSISSDGTVKIDGGYTGVSGGGITLLPNGDIKFDGDMYQTGSKYEVSTIQYTGNYNVGEISKFGVGVNGTDTDYLQIDADGYISDADDPVTINDALTQVGSTNQVTFQGNVDAQNGLDVTGNITVTGTVDGIDLSSDSWVTSAKIADGTIAAADIASSAVTAAKVATGAISRPKILELRPYPTSPSADNKVNVAAGTISVANNSIINFAGGSATFDPVTADSRIDLLAIDSSGNLVVIPGTQAATPTAPTYPTDKLVIAEVTITETALQGVTIDASDIKDVRPFLNLSSGSGDSSITTTDSVIFTIGRDTDETANNITLAFGNTAGGQKSIVYQGASSKDFVFNDDINLGSNTLKFTTNTLTDTKVGNYDAHLLDTSNPHSVTAAQIGGSNIITEINAAGTTGTINVNRLASAVLTQTEGDSAYVNVTGDTISGDLTVQGTLTPSTIVMPAESSITWTTDGKALLTAEYENAIIYGDGSNNDGTMAVKNTADSNWRNYYEWVSQNTVFQDYTILLRYELPPDFSGWSATNAITLSYVTKASLATNNKVDFKIYKAGSSSVVTSSTANASTTWTDIAIDDSALNAVTWNAGDILIAEIKLYSKNGNFVRVGDITLNYTR